jgi:hypothetical protein
MPPMRRLKIWEAHKGICILCDRKIDGVRERWIVEHVRPLALGGPDEDSNCGPAHVACATAKTKTDNASWTKAKRVAAKHIGAKRPSVFRSKWRKKMNGEVVLR